MLLPDLAEWLAVRGHGVVATDRPYGPDDVALVVGPMPTSPDRCVVLEPYPGGAPAAGSSNQPEVVELVRIRVRGTPDTLVSARACQAIHDDLNGRGYTELPSGRLLLNAVARQLSPLASGTDTSNRHEHSTVIQVEHLAPTELRPL